MDICTFWYGPRLRDVDRICLASMVMTGQRVKLFSYAPIENVPAGVELHDASSILPELVFKRLDPGYPNFHSRTTIVQFSDIFRIMLMKHKQGVWLDTDVYLLKQFHPDPSKPYLARENRSVLACPRFICRMTIRLSANLKLMWLPAIRCRVGLDCDVESCARFIIA